MRWRQISTKILVIVLGWVLVVAGSAMAVTPNAAAAQPDAVTAQVMAPQLVAQGGEALALALAKLKAKLPKPDIILTPHQSHNQVVNLETWLAINPAQWKVQSASATVTKQRPDGTTEIESASVTATPVSTLWDFSDMSMSCDGPGQVRPTGASGPAPCGRDWKHTTERSPMQVRARIYYEYKWKSSKGGSGTGSMTSESKPPVSLTVAEVQTWGVETDELPAAPTPPNVELVTVAEDSCSLFIDFFCDVADVADAVIDMAGDLVWEMLPEPVRAIITEMLNFFKGCGDAVVGIGETIASLVQEAIAAGKDPLGYLKDKWNIVLELKEALSTVDGSIAFAKEVLGDAAQIDLLKENPSQWAGSMLCDVAIAAITGGVGGRLAKFVGGDLLDTIRAFNKRHRDNDTDTPDTDTPDPDTDNPDTCKTPVCSCASFPSGTYVLLASGAYRPIEMLSPGERVVTYNTTTRQWSNQPILDQWSADKDGAIATIQLDGGSSIRATEDHRFWVNSQGHWVAAGELVPGDVLLEPDGVTRVESVSLTAPHRSEVWELDVAVNDNFVVGNPGDLALVHNAGRKCFDEPEYPPGYAGRPFAELLPDGTIPPSDKFGDWWDGLSAEELNYLTQDKGKGSIYQTINDRIRGGGGQHEWCMCSTTPYIKEAGWDIDMADIKSFTNDTRDVNGIIPDDVASTIGVEPGSPWQHPTAGHPNDPGANAFHKELDNLIKSSPTESDFVANLPDLLDRWQIPEGTVTIPDW